MRFEEFSFGSIRIDGIDYAHDVVIDGREVRKRKKKPSKKFRQAFGHTPVSTCADRLRHLPDDLEKVTPLATGLLAQNNP